MAINSLASMNQAYMTRLTGMQSGLDTDTIVKNLMRVQQAKYDKMFQSKIRDEWKKEAYTDVNNALRKFKDEYASFLSSKNMLDETLYKSYNVNMQSNPYLSATAGTAAREGSMDVSILALASGSKVTGVPATDDTSGFTATQVRNTKIEDLVFAGGQTVSGSFSFSINGESFSFSSSDTLKTVMDRVNSSDAGVVMDYSQLTNTFTIETKATGNMEGSDILSVSDNGGDFLEILGIAGAAVEGPQQAMVEINGSTVYRDTNRFEIDGITFSLNKATPPGSSVSFTVDRDTKAGVEAVKSLVDSYNTLMTTLYGQLTEKKSYGYAPLTAEQREAMSEKEADLWDSKAKAGLLSRDMSLQRLVDNLQSAFSTALGGVGYASSIGISTSGYRPGQPSLIQIDEVALQAALDTDPDKVFKMFTDRVQDGGGKLISSMSGLIPRLTDVMDAFTISTKDSIGSSINNLDNSIRDWDERMKAESNRLYQLQEGYYKKFTALESAIAKMQAQASSLGLMGVQTQ